MARRYVIGIDGGGTATRALILDAAGQELARGSAGPALRDDAGPAIDVDAVVEAAGDAMRAAGLEAPAASLCAGLAGVGRPGERQEVGRALSGNRLAERVRVVTDAEAAFYDAIGTEPGLLLIAGTGSIAWGRAEDGRERRLGGWGAFLGDEGSAYDIGRRVLRAAARAADGRAPATELLPRLLAHLGFTEPESLIHWSGAARKAEIAVLAPLAIAVADAGDSTAAALIGSAVSALTDHVAVLLQALAPWSAQPPLALAGGLIAPGGPLRERLLDAVRRHPCKPSEASVDAERGAAHLALNELSGTA